MQKKKKISKRMCLKQLTKTKDDTEEKIKKRFFLKMEKDPYEGKKKRLCSSTTHFLASNRVEARLCLFLLIYLSIKRPELHTHLRLQHMT